MRARPHLRGEVPGGGERAPSDRIGLARPTRRSSYDARVLAGYRPMSLSLSSLFAIRDLSIIQSVDWLIYIQLWPVAYLEKPDGGRQWFRLASFCKNRKKAPNSARKKKKSHSLSYYSHLLLLFKTKKVIILSIFLVIHNIKPYNLGRLFRSTEYRYNMFLLQDWLRKLRRIKN